MGEPGDRRFAGRLDAPPDGMRYFGASTTNHRYDIWINDKSIFSPDFRWALVRREEG